MAPIALKVSDGSNMFNDLNSGNMDELPNTWRIYTNTKQALEHGSRLENRSWRRWFLSVQKHTKHQPPVASLEIQYKRNLLIQQRKQFQQFLMEVTMSLPTFDDEQYQPTNDTTHTANTTTTNSKVDNRSNCFSEKYIHLPTTVASHPAMYVATDEPNSLVTAQHNTLQYRLQPPHYPTIIRESSSPTTNKKTKTQKHRFRRPLPVVNADGNDKTVCNDCGTFFTPLWRRYQNKTLCNACGLYWKLHNSPRPGHLIPSMTQRQHPRNSNNTLHDDDQNEIPHCSNCGTSQTTLWRRSELDGAPLCNACGLYAKLHQETRPLSMKTNVIKKRQRLY